MLEKLISTHLEIISEWKIPEFQRYLYAEIEWDTRLLALLGPRGSGKTTMLFQFYKQHYDNPHKCLYLLGDDGDVLNTSLSQIGKDFYLKGGETLIIDEIHKYPGWSREIKNLFDKHPKLQLIISGSSNINIIKEKYDLSRRVVPYHLTGLSFREFINLETGLSLPSNSFHELLKNHQEMAQKIKASLMKTGKKILSLFSDYLEFGYYPYYRESTKTFHLKLMNVCNKVLYEDIPSTFPVNTESIVNLKKLLYLIGAGHPFTVDITNLSKNLGISRNSVYQYLEALTQAELILPVQKSGGTMKTVRKPAKLYLQNPNLYYTIGSKFHFSGKRGTIRETFACGQLNQKYQIKIPPKGDILVDETYCLEIGGEEKSFKQIKNIPNAYVFSDGIEFGYENKIPLYLLGFLY